MPAEPTFLPRWETGPRWISILLSNRVLDRQAGPSGLTSLPYQGHPALPSGQPTLPCLALPPQSRVPLAPGPPGQFSSGCAPATAHGYVRLVAAAPFPQHPPVAPWLQRDSRPPAGSGCDEGYSRDSVHSEGSALPGPLCPKPGWAHLRDVPISGQGQGLHPPHLLHFYLMGNELLGLVGEGLSGRQLRKAADLLHVSTLRVGGAGHPLSGDRGNPPP